MHPEMRQQGHVRRPSNCLSVPAKSRGTLRMVKRWIHFCLYLFQLFFFFLETDLKIPHMLLRSARWRICIPNVCSEPRICLDFSNLQTKSTWDSPDERQYSSAPSTYKVLKLLLHLPGHPDRNPSLPLLMCNV